MIPNFWKESIKPSDFYASINPMLLFSFVLGITPFHISGPFGQRRLQVTFFGFLCSIFHTCIFSICFLISLINNETLIGFFFNTDISKFGETLQKFTGLVGMTMMLLSSLLGRNGIIAVINHIALIDKHLIELGVDMNYNKSLNYFYVILFSIIFINLGFLIGSLKIISNIGYEPPLTAYVSFFSPHVFTSIIVALFLLITHNIKQRFIAINKILQGLYKDFIGKHISIYKPGNAVKRIEVFNTYTMTSKTLGEVIEDSMQIHSLLCDVSRTANRYFTYQLLTIISISFLIIIFDAYYLLETILGQPRKEIQFNTNEFIAFFSCQMGLYIIAVCAVVEGSSKAVNESERTATHIHKLITQVKDANVKEKLLYFSMQLMHQRVYFTAAGLFKVDRTLYFTISGAATTYLIILLQFTSVGNGFARDASAFN